LLSFLKNKWWNILWIKSEKFLILFIFLNLITTSLIGFFTPRVIAGFYASIDQVAMFEKSVWIFISILIAEYLNRIIFQILSYRYIQILVNEVRLNSYSLWLRSPFKKNKKSQIDDFPLGEIIARIMSDTDSVREIVSSGGFGIFIDIIFVLSSLISFLTLNSTTGIMIFVAEIVLILLLIRGSKLMATVFTDVRKVTGYLARELTDLTSGLKELFFSPNNHFALNRGEKIFDDFLSKQLKANIWDAGYYSAAESIYPILIALVMILLPYSKITEVAILAVLIDLIQRSITPIKDVASKVSVIARAKTGIDRIQQFNAHFNAELLERDDFKKLSVTELSFKLNMFQFDEGFSLKDINFDLTKGQILGIVGESGCGKSTLLKLFSGQYQTFFGSINIDDKFIDPSLENQLRSFSSYVSLVSQDSHVFTDTLKFNITLGDETEFEAFWDQSIRSIPYLTRWGITADEVINSKMMSMGQKQLISGLRALYLNKPIILMDELSSGLDSDLESALRDLINFFQKDSITIIVTHRLETILKADQLILIENGRMIADGTLRQLRSDDKFNYFLSHLG
jgi:ATP-binding cassette subfamily B multidrug efflux pump